MDGIVSLLDAEHSARVQDLWAGLEREFGLRGMHATRFPHFSYHVADAYDTSRVARGLEEFVAGRAPFTVRTTGLGTFPGAMPVMFVPVVRTLELSLLHAELWDILAPLAHGTIPVYDPATWVPHVTLAHGDLTSKVLPDLFRYLRGETFDWQWTVDQLVLVTEAGSSQEQKLSFPFR